MTDIITCNKHRFSSYINSLVLFLLAFIIIYWINIVTTIGASYLWNVETTIRNFRVEFLIGPHSKKWNIDSILIIFLSAPFVSLVLAGVISRIRLVFRGENSYLNLFLLWVYFHCVSFSLGAFISAVISKEVMFHALAWLGIPLIFHYVISIILLIIMYLVGYTSCLFFLESCNYPQPSNRYNRQSWLLNAALKPWLTGTVIITLVLLPEIRGYEFGIILLMIIMIVPLFKRSKLIPEVYVYELIDKPKFFWKAGLLAMFLFLILRYFDQIYNLFI